MMHYAASLTIDMLSYIWPMFAQFHKNVTFNIRKNFKHKFKHYRIEDKTDILASNAIVGFAVDLIYKMSKIF